MYYPIQIPYILDEVFLRQIEYKEKVVKEISDFIICYWQMKSSNAKKVLLDNIIIVDGCIDLIVDFDNKAIGFSGMSKSNFHFPIQSPAMFMGLRLMPATFHQLTEKPAYVAMDNFVPLTTIYSDFDIDSFFSLSFEKAKDYLIDFIKNKLFGIVPNDYVKLFNELIVDPPASVSDLCSLLNISSRQCQRDFSKHYGLTPKMVLSILRFQKSLSFLISAKTKPSDILEFTSYYDQSHLINDFKKNIGITPYQLVSKYTHD